MKKLLISFCITLIVLLSFVSVVSADDLIYDISDEQALAYRNILNNMIKEYGAFNEYQYNGVGYANIIEFDGDNNPELLIGYSTDNSKDNVNFVLCGYDYNAYKIAEGKVGGEDVRKTDFVINRVGDVAYIQTTDVGLFDTTVYMGTVKNKKWHVDSYYSYIYLPENPDFPYGYPEKSIYRINGVDVSENVHDKNLLECIGNSPDEIEFKRSSVDSFMSRLDGKINRNKRFDKVDITNDVINIYKSELKCIKKENEVGKIKTSGYVLYDIDNDTVPEMMLNNYSENVGEYLDVLSVSDNKIKRVGLIRGEYSSLWSIPENGLLTYKKTDNGESIESYILIDNSVYGKKVYQSYDVLYENNLNNFYKNSVKLQFNNNIEDFSTIESYFKNKKSVGYIQQFVKVYVNGKLLCFDYNPIILNDRTLVPVRQIFEEFGAHVEWIEATNTVKVLVGNKEIKLTVDKNEMYVNDKMIWLDVPPVFNGESVVVPVRVIAETLNCSVNWDETNFRIDIQK